MNALDINSLSGELLRLKDYPEHIQVELFRKVPDEVLVDLGGRLENLMSDHSGEVAEIVINGEDRLKGLLLLFSYTYYSLPVSPDEDIRHSRVSTLLAVVRKFGMSHRDILILEPLSSYIKELVEDYN